MKRSIAIITVVAVAVAGVVIAKQQLQDRPESSAAPSPAATRNPTSPLTAPSLPSPPASPTQVAKDSDHDGPLPGSALADCLKSGRPTMADFGRTWCKACKAMVPILKQAAKDYQGKAHIVFVDLGKYSKEGREYRVKAMPTQVFFDARGKEVGRHVGFMSGEQITRRMADLGVSR